MTDLHGAVVPNTVGGLLDMLAGLPRTMPLSIHFARLDASKRVVNDNALLMDVETERELYSGLPRRLEIRFYTSI